MQKIAKLSLYYYDRKPPFCNFDSLSKTTTSAVIKLKLHQVSPLSPGLQIQEIPSYVQ